MSIEVISRAEWRAWLEENAETSSGIWLVMCKKHVGNKYVAWPDVVKEALCFGWIDSRTRRVDDDRTMVFVSRRKPGSFWSAANKRHVEELEAEELLAPMEEALIANAKKDGSWSFLDDIENLVDPPDLAEALATASGAQVFWKSLPGNLRKRCLKDIKLAKKEKTRRK